MAKPTAPTDTDAAPHPLKRTGESIKETLESIVVAFILAFVFRAFVIEAFVIPTGSMAATLLGQHGTMTCSDCGFEYKYGKGLGGGVVICPNCYWDGERPPYSERDRNVQSGDRILVLKWPFDIGGEFLGPKRWDVTVFKDPSDGITNYIKRLVGLPNEVIEIIDGDIYAIPVSQLDDQIMSALDQIRKLNYQKGQGFEQGTNNNVVAIENERRKLLEEIRPRLLQQYRIRRKTDKAQKSLWSNVYDHDFPPLRQRMPSRPVSLWQPQSVTGDPAWKTADRKLSFTGPQTDEQSLVFVPADREGRIIDFYAYNPSDRQRSVTDLRLRFVLFFEQGDGFVRLLLTKCGKGFWATLHADGTVQLESSNAAAPGQSLDQIPPDQRRLLGQGKVQLDPWSPSRSLEVDFTNVDYRVTLKINGQTVLQSTDDQYAPDVPALAAQGRPSPPAKIQISARRLNVHLAHVVLERDVYYRSVIHGPGDTNSLDPWRDQRGWGTFGNPHWLREKEYFMLGDNSPQSKDSRMWWVIGPHLIGRGENYQIGTVPEDQLIGKAFFVYWPSGYRVSPKLQIGLIPNVGRMRWIR